MKFAFCNEMFGSQPFADVFSTTAKLGYTGVEIAPFTLGAGDTVDIREVSSDRRALVRRQAEEAGLEVIGLHMLLAKTDGPYLTSPQADVRAHTTEYLKALGELCSELGGTVMVFGSPFQRNRLPGVTEDDAMEYAAEVIRGAMPTLEGYGVTMALEPLGPSEGDFLLTAASAIKLAKMIDSTHCRLHLDVKAMSTEEEPIDAVIRQNKDWLVHFHANDPNLLGPGMGEVDFEPIFAALKEIRYDGWVSIEPFSFEPSPEEIARVSIEYMRRMEDAA